MADIAGKVEVISSGQYVTGRQIIQTIIYRGESAASAYSLCEVGGATLYPGYGTYATVFFPVGMVVNGVSAPTMAANCRFWVYMR